MIANTINDDKTIAGGGEGAILAGWHRSPIACREHSRKSI